MSWVYRRPFDYRARRPVLRAASTTTLHGPACITAVNLAVHSVSAINLAAPSVSAVNLAVPSVSNIWLEACE